jgi:hypothetical protein
MNNNFKHDAHICIQFCSLLFSYYAQYKPLYPAPKDGFY